MSDERWLPVVGFEGFLEVSDRGRIRSLDRISEVAASCDGRRAYTRSFKGRILKGKINPRDGGYLDIPLNGGGKVRNAKVHHVVLEAFVGPMPAGMECCHGNNDPMDNRLVNLRWDTRLANHADKVACGSSKKTRCIHGHEFTPDNTYMARARNGIAYKRCRVCRARQSAIQIAKRSERRRSRRGDA